MIRVELVSQSSATPELLASFAAKTCYEGDEPQLGKLIDVKKRLFDVGHHTTLQHSYFTFFIDGIAISDVTLGLHLAGPFYNTSQRSGRFCATMFENPNFDEIEKYLRHYWSEFSDYNGFGICDAMNAIKEGIKVYKSNIKDAAKIAAELIRKERPHASDSYVEKNAPKFAQEQLRVFIPTIFPTALTFTVNLSTLTALYRSAWSPTLVDVTQKMADAILLQYPGLRYMFERKNTSFDISALTPDSVPDSYQGIAVKPKLKLIDAGNDKSFIMPSASGEDTHPIDLLHFDPRYMDNNTEEIKTEVEISLATMGQDQRHRTIRRSLPKFTGRFYLPPIAKELGLKKSAETFFNNWLRLFNPAINIPHSLVCAIAPYGAMVKYKKSASYNAIAHESAKRLCWCSQEEIYNLNLILRKKIISNKGLDSPLLSIFPPACVRTGKCGEGDRYCGRNMKEDCFVERRV